jgi:hypothetical protein
MFGAGVAVSTRGSVYRSLPFFPLPGVWRRCFFQLGGGASEQSSDDFSMLR